MRHRKQQQADPPHWWEPDEQAKHPSAASLQGSTLEVGEAMAGLTPIENPQRNDREAPCCTDNDGQPRPVAPRTAELDEELSKAEGLKGNPHLGPDAVQRTAKSKR